MHKCIYGSLEKFNEFSSNDLISAWQKVTYAKVATLPFRKDYLRRIPIHHS